MADQYASVQGGGLKLKGVHDAGVKKKKKKRSKEKEAKRTLEQISSGEGTSVSSQSLENTDRPKVDPRTKAEVAFFKAQEKRNAEQILQKAAKTHKERIIEFNKHLDTLTEHFDIPKVSWTK